jgi:hypothetical protein
VSDGFHVVAMMLGQLRQLQFDGEAVSEASSEKERCQQASHDFHVEQLVKGVKYKVGKLSSSCGKLLDDWPKSV